MLPDGRHGGAQPSATGVVTCHVAVSRPERLQIPKGAEQAGERLVALRADLPLARQLLTGRPHAVRREPLEQIAAAVEHAQVRREELVRAADQEVRLQCRDVDRHVWRGVHRVDIGQGANRVGGLDGAADVGDRAEGVRREPDRHDLRSIAEHRVERIEVERRPVIGELDPADDEAAVLGQGQPWRDVRVVVEPRHHDLVAGRQVATDRTAHRKGQGRHVRTERDLVGIVGADEIGGRSVDLVEERIGLDRCGEGAAMVGVAALEIVRHGGDAFARDLRAARAIQVGDARAIKRPRQRREVIAQRGDVQAALLADRGHGRILL